MQRGISAVEAGVGPDHPRMAALLSNYAEFLNQLGRFAEAREMARRALAVFEREGALDSSALSYPLVALGLGYLDEDMIEEALPPLERAVVIRDRSEKHLAYLGEAHFALARALKKAGRDGPRARALALAARAEYAGDATNPSSALRLTQIDAWLAADARDAGDPALDAGSGSPIPSAACGGGLGRGQALRDAAPADPSA